MKVWYRRYVPAGSIYRRGRLWWFAWVGPDGKRRHSSLRTTSKSEAGNLARQLYLAGETQRHARERGLRAYEKHIEGTGAIGHIQAKARTVARFYAYSGACAAQEVTTAMVNAYLDRRRADGASAKTRTNERANLSDYCRWLVGEGELDHNPVAASQRPRPGPEERSRRQEIVHLTRSELAATLRLARREKMWPVIVAIYTGLRLSELRRLRWTDLGQSSDGPTVTVRGKTGVHTIPMHRKLPGLFRKIPKVAEVIFPGHSHKWWNDYLKPLRATIPKLGRKGGGWHDFRRTLASLLIQAGTRIEIVSKLLRHSNVATTSRSYAHLTAEHGREALKRL